MGVVENQQTFSPENKNPTYLQFYKSLPCTLRTY